MSHITFYDDYGIMAYPNLQTGKEFTVSFIVDSTLWYRIDYIGNKLKNLNNRNDIHELDVVEVANMIPN